MEFFDFFPGLSRSNEAYFGREAPLANTLIEGSKKLIKFFDGTNTDSKRFYSELTKITTEFGSNIARDVNAESCFIIIIPDKTENASAYDMMVLGDTCYKYEQDGRTFVAVDFDKVADLEDIVITNEGYKFKNKKGKILFITINYGMIINQPEPEKLAAVICHEIGHCFQQGIYGLYKRIADASIAGTVQLKRAEVGKLESIIGHDHPFIAFIIKKTLFGDTLFGKAAIALLSYLWLFNGNLFSSGIMAKFGAWVERVFWSDKAKDTTFKMKDKLKVIDKDKESKEAQHVIDEIYRNDSAYSVQRIIASTSKQYNNTERSKWIKSYDEENKEAWKKYNERMKNESEAKKSIAFYLYHFFRCIRLDFWLLSENIINVLSLNNYTANQYAKNSFYKKYEFFADIFATSYGFGADLWKSNTETNINFSKQIDDFYLFGLNKMPFFKSLFKTQLLIYELNASKYDAHGTNRERAINTYTALQQELKTNPCLTAEQKKEIQADIQTIIEADEAYYKEEKESGFWFRYYNKLIDSRIKGEESKDTVDQVLKPIQEVCKENIGKIK